MAIGENDEHAERRVIGYLLETGNLSRSEPMYIGISKLCCAACIGTVCVVNEVCKTNIGLMIEQASEEKTIEHGTALEEATIELAKKEIEEDAVANAISSSSSSSSSLEQVRTRVYHGLSFRQHTPKYLEGTPYLSGNSYVKSLIAADDLNTAYSKFQKVANEKTLSFFSENKEIYAQLQETNVKINTILSEKVVQSKNVKNLQPNPTMEDAKKRAKEEYTRKGQDQRSKREAGSSAESTTNYFY